jgi:hypothetical protein
LQVLCLSCSTVRMEHAIADGLDDLWEAPAPEQESHACEVVAYPPRTAMELVEAAELSDHDRLQKLENEIFAENLVIVMDATRFREIPPDAKEPLPEWIAELGPTEAWKRFRVAQAAWMGAKDAPVGISIAAKTVSNLSKARALRDAGAKTLNIEKIVFAAPTYGSIEVQGEER